MPGSQSPWANFFLKIDFAVVFYLILASVSLRGIPHPQKFFNSNIMAVGEGLGARKPKPPCQFFLKSMPWGVLPNFSFRQLPPASAASVAFRIRIYCLFLTPWPVGGGGGREAKTPGPYYLTINFAAWIG